MFGFMGVSLANCQDNDINPIPICKHLTELFSAGASSVGESVEEMEEVDKGERSIQDYQFGRIIAKGCDAAVHEVIQHTATDIHTHSPTTAAAAVDPVEEIISEDEVSVDESDSNESVTTNDDSANIEGGDSTGIDVGGSHMETESEDELCVKVMFNYGNSSNTSAIERAMRRELLPALMTTDNGHDFLCGAHVKKKKCQRRLPPHPNIISIRDWFVDETPLLEGALDAYPVALPHRLSEVGCARSRTLFIVMKRYESTLADYLKAYGVPRVRESVLILFQLLQGIRHLQTHGIAHRDLKSDNLLLEWKDGCPQLVVTDFGHCCTGPLLMSYPNDDMDKGGNGLLMAPEIANAKPGPGSYLDFRASDSWAAGAIAYELFTGVNPFYTDAYDNCSYKHEELPELPADTVPECMNTILHGLLEREPNKRLPASVAACMIALWLWAPTDWFMGTSTEPSKVAVIRWLLNLSAASLLGADEHQHMESFLRQLDWQTLWHAVQLMAEYA